MAVPPLRGTACGHVTPRHFTDKPSAAPARAVSPPFPEPWPPLGATGLRLHNPQPCRGQRRPSVRLPSYDRSAAQREQLPGGRAQVVLSSKLRFIPAEERDRPGRREPQSVPDLHRAVTEPEAWKCHPGRPAALPPPGVVGRTGLPRRRRWCLLYPECLPTRTRVSLSGA